MLDVSKHYCPNKSCECYGVLDTGNIRGGWQYGTQKWWLLVCRRCGTHFSERRGTVFYGLRAPEEKIMKTLQLLAEGNGVRATARIMGVSTHSVTNWLAAASQHVKEVNDYLMTNLHVDECQLDELWGFVKKNKSASIRQTRKTRNAGRRGRGLPSTAKPKP